MKFWDQFLASIFNPFANFYFKGKRSLFLEKYLKDAFNILDANTKAEILYFVKEKQHESGLFVDKAGNPDIYYSLFGFFLARSLNLEESLLNLQSELQQIDLNSLKKDVDLFCFSILQANLNPSSQNNKILKTQIIAELDKNLMENSSYKWFMGLIALFYSGEYYLSWKYLRKFKKQQNNPTVELPSTIISAELILKKISKKPKKKLVNQLAEFYNPNGGFRALKKAPLEDLLSTAVCLFALKFVGTDLRIIKPETLSFIETLYMDGGFSATQLDSDTDLEYTFYGLLAMASLN